MITVLVPTRGRPDSAVRLATAFQETCTFPNTRLDFIVDTDDPAKNDYYEALHPFENPPVDVSLIISDPVSPNPGIVWPLNQTVSDWHFAGIIGFMGDDHLPKTVGWDEAIENVFKDSPIGVAYGNDLLQGENLATAAFISAKIVNTLGYMAPPVLWHLYVDNFWMDLGRGLNSLHYLPEVIIEHLHYSVGKSDKDDTYEGGNSGRTATHDKAAYAMYKATGLQADLKKLESLL